MIDMQKFVDALMAAGRQQRSLYHLTLGEAIKRLTEIDPSMPFVVDGEGSPGPVDSYRGYYSDLAFRPSGDLATVGAALANLQAASGATFEGYKGGDFVMKDHTPLWVSSWGECSDRAVMDLRVIEGRCVLETRIVE